MVLGSCEIITWKPLKVKCHGCLFMPIIGHFYIDQAKDGQKTALWLTEASLVIASQVKRSPADRAQNGTFSRLI